MKEDAVVTLAHGSGGRKMHRLISEIFVRYFDNPILRRLEDAAELEVSSFELRVSRSGARPSPLIP